MVVVVSMLMTVLVTAGILQHRLQMTAYTCTCIYVAHTITTQTIALSKEAKSLLEKIVQTAINMHKKCTAHFGVDGTCMKFKTTV